MMFVWHWQGWKTRTQMTMEKRALFLHVISLGSLKSNPKSFNKGKISFDYWISNFQKKVRCTLYSFPSLPSPSSIEGDGWKWGFDHILTFIKSMINLWSTDFINFINGRAKGPLWQSSGVDKRLRSNICGFTSYQGKHFEDGAIMLEVGLSWNVSREGENLALIPIQRRATLECNRIGTI